MNTNIEEYEKLRMRINNLHNIIGNIQLLLNSIGDSDICPFCRSKINIDKLREEYNMRKKKVNELDRSIQYLDIE